MLSALFMANLPSMPPRTQHPITSYGLMTEHPRPWQRGMLSLAASHVGAPGTGCGSPLAFRTRAGGSPWRTYAVYLALA